MTYIFLILIIISIALAFGITLSINTFKDHYKKIEDLEKDIEELQNLCTLYITQDDLDDFCESLYDNIQNVSEKFQDTLEDEISSK